MVKDRFFDSFKLNSEAVFTCSHLQVVFVIRSQVDSYDHMC